MTPGQQSSHQMCSYKTGTTGNQDLHAASLVVVECVNRWSEILTACKTGGFRLWLTALYGGSRYPRYIAFPVSRPRAQSVTNPGNKTGIIENPSPKKRLSRHRIGRLLAVVGLLFIAAATLTPLPQQSAAAAATPLWCLVCGEDGGVDVLNNILLFVPLGLGLRLMRLRTSHVVLLAASVSLAIELLQLIVITGRDASLSDLLTNTLGSWTGALGGSIALKSSLRPPTES
jgi:VanZ like family